MRDKRTGGDFYKQFNSTTSAGLREGMRERQREGGKGGRDDEGEKNKMEGK